MPLDLGRRVLDGDQRAIARLVTLLEDGDPIALDAMRELVGAPRAHLIGITGPPGSGKSTLVDKLIGAYRERGERVGVLAVDPSSP
ncbi:MAG: nucleoside-triphosphatase, partial [Spirochaetaceae bacterium]|nr:nucleoside-triphosphatase [Spirochaetaceae bacterium]